MKDQRTAVEVRARVGRKMDAWIRHFVRRVRGWVLVREGLMGGEASLWSGVERR